MSSAVRDPLDPSIPPSRETLFVKRRTHRVHFADHIPQILGPLNPGILPFSLRSPPFVLRRFVPSSLSTTRAHRFPPDPLCASDVIMVDANAGNWRMKPIAARSEGATSAADPPAAHHLFLGPSPCASVARHLSLTDRPPVHPSSAFLIHHSAFGNIAGSIAAVESLMPGRKRCPNLPHKKPIEFFETNPNIPPGDPKKADSSRKTNPTEPTLDRQRAKEIEPCRQELRNADFAILNSPFAITFRVSTKSAGSAGRQTLAP